MNKKSKVLDAPLVRYETITLAEYKARLEEEKDKEPIHFVGFGPRSTFGGGDL